MPKAEKFYQYGKEKIKVTSKQDVYEKIYLRAVIESYAVINKSTGLENQIRDRLAWYLQKEHPFTSPLFQYEILDIVPERINLVTKTERSRADLCFHWSDWGRFTFECKRLFHQPSKNKPYLDDGLIRFIEMKYTRTNQYAAMIGFVVSGKIDSIFETIANDTEKFHPSNPPQAIKTPINKYWKLSFTSFHERENKENIQIYHLLFEFTGK